MSPVTISVDLIPGQQANIGGSAVQPLEVDVEKVVAWTERRLIFEGDTLETIVSEFNRYNLNQISIEDEALSEVRLTGVFGANNVDSFLQLLVETQSVVVLTREDGSRELIKQR